MGLGFDSLGLVGHPWAPIFLVLTRLLSVLPDRAMTWALNRPGKESLMGALVRTLVALVQSVLETAWTCGAGLLVAHWLD
ncbi:hypothetical protein BJD99_05785 [Rhodococcus sp. 1163]|nr:hypothetical protein BJD99_05785 [Rhodococcus sp. 1163]